MSDEQAVVDERLNSLTEDAFGGDDDGDNFEVIEPVEAAEPAEAVEAIEEEEELDDDDSQQETVAETVETPVVEAPTESYWNKEAQRLQQESANYQRLIEKMIDNPTPAAQKAVDKQKSRLDQIVEAESEDVDPYSATQTVADEVRTMQADREKRQASREQLAATNDRQDRMDFRQANPQIADQYDDLLVELSNAMDKFRPKDGDVVPHETWTNLVNEKWGIVVEGATAKVVVAKTKTDDEVKTPVGTNPVRKTKGTRKKPAKDPKLSLDNLRDEAFGD